MAAGNSSKESKAAGPHSAQKQFLKSMSQHSPKPQLPTTVSTSNSTFSILPLTFPPVYPSTSTNSKPSYPRTTTHYLYIAPHMPSLPTPTSARSLLLSNIPIDATPTHLRTLFARPDLGGVRIESVSFDDEPDRHNNNDGRGAAKSGKKRKRAKGGANIAMTVVNAEGEEEERLRTGLPETWDRRCHRSGGCAVVVFVDSASMERAMKGVRRVIKGGGGVVWGEGVQVGEGKGNIPALGSERYKTHTHLQYPSPAHLQTLCDTYMTHHNALTQRTRARTRPTTDSDGFTPVTRGARLPAPAPSSQLGVPSGLDAPAHAADGQPEGQAGKKRKSEGLTDFYRFQRREEKKRRAGAVREGFEGDRERVLRMRSARGGGVVPMG